MDTLRDFLTSGIHWLAENAHSNLGPEVVLRSLSPDKLYDYQIARRGQDIVAISIRTPRSELFLEGDVNEASLLLSLATRLKMARKITVDEKLAPLVRDVANGRGGIAREHTLLAMRCSVPPESPSGRWATPADIPSLKTYQKRYNEERNTSIAPQWDALVNTQQVAVLERSGEIVSVVKRSGETSRYACLGGTYSFKPTRRNHNAYALMSFAIGELLRERPQVHLIVDDDNYPAIALYEKLGFKMVGGCYMCYPCIS